MSQPGQVKWHPHGGVPKWYEQIPKAVLYVIARQLGATTTGYCDDLEAGEIAILNEWRAQFNAGNVPQRPPVRP